MEVMMTARCTLVAACFAAVSLGAGAAAAQQSPGSAHPTPQLLRFRPQPEFEVQGGVGGWTRGLARATWLGPSWQARVGVQFFPWLSVGAVYNGLYTAGVDNVVGEGVGLLNTTGYGAVRLIAPLPHVHPYGFVGFGYSWTSVLGGNAQTSPLRSGGNLALPFGGGLEVELTQQWSIGAAGTYQRSLGDSTLAPSMPELGQGDNWNAAVSVGYRMQ
jgi:hypothetical protein